LAPEELKEVRKVAKEADAAQGDRYPPEMTGTLLVETPEL